MHLCKGPINYYFAVNAKSRHDDNCPQNHHKDENRREQDRLYRERKRTEISGTLVGQEALSSILNKTARSHENEILRNLSVATPPLSGKQEGQKQKRTLTYNQQSDAAISFALKTTMNGLFFFCCNHFRPPFISGRYLSRISRIFLLAPFLFAYRTIVSASTR